MIEVKKIKNFEKGEIEELTSATMNAIQEGIGFGWIKKPAKRFGVRKPRAWMACGELPRS